MPADISVRIRVDGPVVDSTKVGDAIDAVLQVVALEGDRLFGETHRSFSAENQPRKVMERGRGTTRRRIRVGRDGRIYNLVSLGSPAHEITPTNAGQLSFFTGYRAATQPGVVSSRPRQSFGPRVTADKVDHPGFDPRKFDAAVEGELLVYVERNIDALTLIAQNVFDS